MVLTNLLYRLAHIVCEYGDVTAYQISDCMHDAQLLEHTETYADTMQEPETLYFGIRHTGTVLLYDAPDVFNMMRDFNRACCTHDWYRLYYDPIDGYWHEPVKIEP